ncbi:MAG TPA: hypothetical protein VII11_00630 [Bacteroidota bacterium]
MSDTILTAIIAAPTTIGALYFVLLIIKAVKTKNGNGNGYEKLMLAELQKISANTTGLPDTLKRIEDRQHRSLADTNTIEGKLDLAMERQQTIIKKIGA